MDFLWASCLLLGWEENWRVACLPLANNDHFIIQIQIQNCSRFRLPLLLLLWLLFLFINAFVRSLARSFVRSLINKMWINFFFFALSSPFKISRGFTLGLVPLHSKIMPLPPFSHSSHSSFIHIQQLRLARDWEGEGLSPSLIFEIEFSFCFLSCGSKKVDLFMALFK